MNTIGNLGGAVAGILTGKILDWHIGDFAKGTEAYDVAKNQGWTVNILLYGSAYILAVICWLWFDPTKPVAPDARDTVPEPPIAPPEPLGEHIRDEIPSIRKHDPS